MGSKKKNMKISEKVRKILKEIDSVLFRIRKVEYFKIYFPD